MYLRTFYIPVYPGENCSCHYGCECGDYQFDWNSPLGFAITHEYEIFKRYEKGVFDTDIPEELEY
jgi:hypothetical protein